MKNNHSFCDFITGIVFFLLVSSNALAQTITTYKYDSLGRLVKVEDSSKTVDYKYDNAGNRKNVNAVVKSTSSAIVKSSSSGVVSSSATTSKINSSQNSTSSSSLRSTSSYQSTSSYISSSNSSPVVSSTGINTTYNPWAVWVNGSNFTRASTITIYDTNSQVWGAPRDYSFNSSNLVTFGLPANIPPSKCNLISTCTLTFKIRNEYGQEGTGSFTLPSANIFPPSVSSTGTNTAYNPWVVWVTGSNITSTSTVTVYDSNNQLWGAGTGLAFTGNTGVNFSLPGNIPPSKCNLTTTCTLTFKIRNEYGQEGTGSFTMPSANIFPPSVSSAGANTDYSPWAVWVNGNNFTRASTVTVYDSNNQVWGAGAGFSFNNSTLVTFSLPSNIPPSKCNLTTTCTLTFKIRNEYGQEGTGSFTLPSANIFPPSVSSAGTNTDYSPWAVWVNGSNFTRNSTVTLFDINNQLWGAGVGFSFNNSSLVTFTLPSNSPPSRCNQTASCTITFKVRNEYGQEGAGTVSLPKQ